MRLHESYEDVKKQIHVIDESPFFSKSMNAPRELKDSNKFNNKNKRNDRDQHVVVQSVVESNKGMLKSLRKSFKKLSEYL